MKSRRVILTIKVETRYSLASLRSDLNHIHLSCGRWIVRYPVTEDLQYETHERIVQVQANAIRPERKAKRAKGAK